jgi:hypothetical protein
MRFAFCLFAAALALPPITGAAFAQSTDCSVVGISADEAPPPLPDYDQPPVPGPGYLWTPGYWAWNNVDYYWVPGTWVEPPQPEVFWTPPYWAFINGAYVFRRGYWGPHVGFYGGVNYGYGYGGDGFEGGRWDHGAFFYNRAVTNLNGLQINNVYDKTVVINNNSRVSYNGGRDGLTARPTAADEAIAREPHIAPTHAQTAHLRAASLNSGGFATANHGRPTVAATSRPGDFNGPGVTGSGATHRMEHENGAMAPMSGGKPNEMAPHETTPHHEELAAPGGEPGVGHEHHGAPATTGGMRGGVPPVEHHAPRQHNPEAMHTPTGTPPTHQEHVVAPRPPAHEMQHREPPHGAGMMHAAPMHMGGGGRPPGGGHPPHEEHKH